MQAGRRGSIDAWWIVFCLLARLDELGTQAAADIFGMHECCRVDGKSTLAQISAAQPATGELTIGVLPNGTLRAQA